MDIRDLKTLEVPYRDGFVFGDIADLQEQLLKKYVGIERLPQYPFDLDVKSNQVIIKDFIARITEEIGEGFESLMEILQRPDLEVDSILSRIQNFNEEMSDALHFLMETTIVSGMDFGKMKEYISRHLSEDNLVMLRFEYPDPDIMSMLYAIATQSLDDYKVYGYKGLPIILHPDLGEPFMKGGIYVSKIFVKEFSILAWEFTYRLMIARNSLKNKPWKQTEMTTDLNVYFENLIEAWISFIKLCVISNIDPESLFHIYYKKNHINQFRIKSKY